MLPTLMANLVPFLIYWLVLFVACFTVVEVGQDQLYDEVTPHVGLKVAGGAMILAALATAFRPSYESIFTTGIAWTLLQGVVWFLVFTFIFQFHPWHALAAGLATMLLVTGLATLGVDSLTKPAATPAPVRARGAPPVRKSLSPIGGTAEPAPAAK